MALAAVCVDGGIKFGRKVQCKGCGLEDVFSRSKVVIRCSECGSVGRDSNSVIDLCPDCFAGRVEVGSHKATHAYTVIDDGNYGLLGTLATPAATLGGHQKGQGHHQLPHAGGQWSSAQPQPRRWTAREHQLLLDNLERHGYGNWEDIAKAINGTMGYANQNNPNFKTPAAAQEEYTRAFLNSQIGRLTWREDLRGKARDHTGSLKESIAPLPTPQKRPQNQAGPVSDHEAILLGYLPLREDFEVEYDNDAEKVVSTLQYKPMTSCSSTALENPAGMSASVGTPLGGGSASNMSGLQATMPQQPSVEGLQAFQAGQGQALGEDEELEDELKACHVEIYLSRLRQREKRKEAARDHGLVPQFFKENPLVYDQRGRASVSSPAASSSSKSARRTFSVYNPNAREAIVNLDQAVLEKLKPMASFQTVAEYQAFLVNMDKEKAIKSRIKELVRHRKNGITSLAESVEFNQQQKLRKNSKKRRQQQQQQQLSAGGGLLLDQSVTAIVVPQFEGHYQTASSAAPTPASSMGCASPVSIKSEDPSSEFQNSPCSASIPAFTLSSPPIHYQPSGALQPLSAQTAGNSPLKLALVEERPFQITAYDGHEILSANEKKLCTNLRLSPAHYISYKTCLLANHLQRKKGQTPKPLNPAGLDKNNRKTIMNFLIRAGWITAY